MTVSPLKIDVKPRLRAGRMVLAFTGWMDGGEVSTGTVQWLARSLDARRVASIDPEGFCIYNLPGPMEVAALFRPHAKIEDGVVTDYQPAENAFFCAEKHQLVLFCGREPNFNWSEFTDCIFSFASEAGVSTIYFVGSVGGATPHTREPRLLSTVSDEQLKPAMDRYGISFTNYEGPASFATCLLAQARARGFQMASLVAEIPAYIQGANPKSIEAVVRKLAAVLDLPVGLDRLRQQAAAWEERLNEVLERTPDLAKFIRKLEEDYDNEVFDTQMGDLKEWLQQRGIRVD